MSKVQTVFRVAKNRDNPYVMLNKKFLEHAKLSYRAKGILAYILSKPDHWKLTVSDLVKHGKEGRDAIYSTLNELIQLGFMQHICYRENGKISHYEYIVFEQPLTIPVERITYTTITKGHTLKQDTPTPVPSEILDVDSQEEDQVVPLTVLSENPEPAQSLDTPHVSVPPGNPDPEKPTLVSNDLNNKLINNKKRSSSARCAIFELWEEAFQVDLRDWEYEALLKVSSRPLVLQTICRIQEHHTLSSIQSPFAFVYSCVTNGGYTVPKKQTKPAPAPHSQEKKCGPPLPKAVQRQLEGRHLEMKMTPEELAEKKARIEEKLRVMYERRTKES